MSPEEQSDMNAAELSETIESLCVSKAEEFQLIGYELVTGEDVWNCVSSKYRKTGMPQLHVMVNDILSLKVTQYMNWLQMRMYSEK